MTDRLDGQRKVAGLGHSNERAGRNRVIRGALDMHHATREVTRKTFGEFIYVKLLPPVNVCDVNGRPWWDIRHGASGDYLIARAAANDHHAVGTNDHSQGRARTVLRDPHIPHREHVWLGGHGRTEIQGAVLS